MERRYIYYLIVAFVFVLSTAFYSCKKTFEYSPYSADIADTYKGNTTQINIDRIKKLSVDESGKFKIALLSDTHNYHDQLVAAIKHINNDEEIKFVVICGDLSDQGLQKEYTILYDMLKKLNKPVLTVIGNHDYLANAETIYADMFGEKNYTVDFGHYTFLFFDNVFWEKNGTPDFTWLNSQASIAKEKGNTPILISHIPPFGDQYDEQNRKMHEKVVSDNKIPLSIHGHTHAYAYGNVVPESDYKYLVVPAIGDKIYYTVTFGNYGQDKPEINAVKF
jgi:Icc-related predicted phosphoesterase